MKKIYWFMQQAEAFGGIEMVTSNLISLLNSHYDITLVMTSKKPEKFHYQLPENLKIVYLNYPSDIIQMDKYWRIYKNQHRYFKLFCFFFRIIYHTILKRFYVRHKIKKMTTKEDILIASSFDNYILMPRGRLVYFHYHFNAKTFFSFGDFWMRRLMRKPNYYIFLTEETMQAFLKKRPRWKDRVYYIYNPSRFDRELHEDVHKPVRLISIGRLTKQKNPLLLLESVCLLKEKNIPFQLDILGEGELKEEMEKYVQTHHLASQVHFHGAVMDVLTYLRNADIHVATSLYEGFPLNVIEASSLSCYTLSTNWGDAIKEVIYEGKNGTIVSSFCKEDFAKALEDLILSEDLKKKKITAYENAERFSGKAIVDKWKEILK